MGCNKDKKESNTAAAAPAAEQLKQVEAKYQSQDPNAAANSDLTCKYVLVKGSNGSYTISKAEVKTSGECNWSDLQGKAAAAGTISDAQASQIVSAVVSGGPVPEQSPKWNCVSYKIKTSSRTVGAQDCKDGSGAGQGVGSTISSILGL